MDELIPKEVLTNMPRVTLTGSERLHVEQHKGLVTYHDDQICFKTSCGSLCIGGNSLRFRTYTSNEAIIIGVIQSVTYQPTGGRK